MLLDGTDVTDSFSPVPGERTLEGVVDGLALGDNLLEVESNGRGTRSPQSPPWCSRTIPISGPIFSGPQQEVFLCSDDGDRAQRRARPRPRRGLRGRDGGVVQVPHPGRRLGRLRSRRAAAGGHEPDDDDGRRHRRLHRALGARDDQPLHLLDRRALAERAGPRPAGPVGLEPTAHLLLPGRRRASATTRATPAAPACSTTHGLSLGLRGGLLHGHKHRARTTTSSWAARRRSW